MIIKAQGGTEHDIYIVGLSGTKIYCRDNADKRKKHWIGEYETPSRAAAVYRKIMGEMSGYYEMPEA